MYEADQAYLIEEIIDKLSNLVRVGKVIQVNKKGQVKVKTGNIITPWVDAIYQKAGSIKKYCPISPKETVLLISPMGDLNQAFALPGIFTNACKIPIEEGKHSQEVHEYSNNLSVSFDPSGLVAYKCKKFSIKNKENSLVVSIIEALESIKQGSAGGDPIVPHTSYEKALEKIKSFELG